MDTISVGDVYFLTSPFHIDSGEAHKTRRIEKRLCYLLGIPSARPVVVIREPVHWNKFNTVTIIEGESDGWPAMDAELNDIHGNPDGAHYRFVPHSVHTVPTSRLGRRIGHLSIPELRKLLGLFHWVNDIFLRTDVDGGVPEEYRRALESQQLRGEDGETRERFSVDLEHGTMNAEEDDELRNIDISGYVETAASSTRLPGDENRPFVAVERAPDACANTEIDVIAVPTERRFPASMFDEEVLRRIAGRFDIDDGYYLNTITKRRMVLREDEIGPIRCELTEEEFADVLAVYDRMTPMDAILLGPRLPGGVLAEVVGLNKPRTMALKRLCNVMRDMTKEEYERRLVELEKSERKRISMDGLTDAEKAAHIRSWLNRGSCMNMPDDIAEIFLTLPAYIVKRYWTGPAFQKCFDDARRKYKQSSRTKFRSETTGHYIL